MKGVFKSLAFLGFVVAIVSVLYYLYKTKCPHACRVDDDWDLDDDFDYKNASDEEISKRLFPDDEEIIRRRFSKKKKSAPHARGYFNLNRIREAEGIIRE